MVAGIGLRVNEDRMRAAFEALAAIGRTPEGGVHRPAFSEAHSAARRWFLERAGSLGLQTGIDSAGNHRAWLRCGAAESPTLLLGSHLDSVPNGGRFDGALGVVAALEVLATIQEAGISLQADLEAIDFTDEEGRFVGLLGSRALAGVLDRAQLDNPHGNPEAFVGALRRSGLHPEGILAAVRRSDDLAGYFELHVEQGAHLAEQGIQIGVVTGIVGIRTYALTFVGRADHAGTTPLPDRLDAAQGACAFTLAARELVLREFPGCVVNVGNMHFAPGAYNVAPETVTVALEFRAENQARLDMMETALLHQANLDAARFGLQLVAEARERVAPTFTDAVMQSAIADACELLGLCYVHLPSGAGHDAQSLAHVCPAGMIFVPSVAGRGHSPQEFTQWQDCFNGANVLLQAVLHSS